MKKRKISKLGAVGLSLICPGLGHLYLKSWGKAILFLSLTVICLWQITAPISSIIHLVSSAYAQLHPWGSDELVSKFASNSNPLATIKRVMFWSGLFTIIFFWALIDSFVLARKMQIEQKKKEIM